MIRPAAIALLLAVVTSSLAAEPTSLKALVGPRADKKDTTINISVKTRQTAGDKERQFSEELQAFIAATRPGRVLLRLNKQSHLSDTGLSAMWTDDLQTHRTKLFPKEAARWSDFAKMKMDVFWVIPCPGNITYFDENFNITSVNQQSDKVVAEFELRETPTDTYWARLREKRGIKMYGTLTIVAKTGLVSAATVEMNATGHSRFFDITATHTFEPISEATFDIPPKIAEAIEAKKAQE